MVNQDGVSLAQLPNHLKNKLPFNLVLSELGFNKLKDLLLSMSDKIRIENRSHNHPFAVLISPEPFHRSASSSEDFHTFSPHYQGYSRYGPAPLNEMGMRNMMYSPNDYEMYKYNQSYPMTPTSYYPMYPNYPPNQNQPELRRNESSSSFQSLGDKLNFSKGGNDSFYIPQAASLYGGSIGGQGGYHHHLNISHCRNNTGSDIGYDNALSLQIKHKQGNLSQDFTLQHSRPTKIWLNPLKDGPYNDFVDDNSSGFLSDVASMFEPRSRSTSPNHTRMVSTLNDNNYYYDPNQGHTLPRMINRISEEHKSDEDNTGSTQEMEDIIAPILTDTAQQTKPSLAKQVPSNKNTKLIPTSKIFLPSKKNAGKDTEAFAQNIVSASKLKAKTDAAGK